MKVEVFVAVRVVPRLELVTVVFLRVYDVVVVVICEVLVGAG